MCWRTCGGFASTAVDCSRALKMLPETVNGSRRLCRASEQRHFATVGDLACDNGICGRPDISFLGRLTVPCNVATDRLRQAPYKRDRGRSSRCRCPRGDGGADGVDGNGDGSSGCPCGGSRESASPSRRPGPPALGHCPVACVGQRPSFARSASRSTTSRKAGHAHKGHFHHGRRGIPAARIMASHNRPHRPHRP